MNDLRGQAVDKIKEEDIKKIKEYFKKNDFRMCALFNIGINVGLRISDLITLKFEDITSGKKIYLTEKKTKKKRIITLNKLCIETLERLKKEYISHGIPGIGYYLSLLIENF